MFGVAATRRRRASLRVATSPSIRLQEICTSRRRRDPRLRGSSAPRPRRRRDLSPRNIYVAPAAVPRRVATESPRRGAAAIRQRKIPRGERTRATLRRRTRGRAARGSAGPAASWAAPPCRPRPRRPRGAPLSSSRRPPARARGGLGSSLRRSPRTTPSRARPAPQRRAGARAARRRRPGSRRLKTRARRARRACATCPCPSGRTCGAPDPISAARAPFLLIFAASDRSRLDVRSKIRTGRPDLPPGSRTRAPCPARRSRRPRRRPARRPAGARVVPRPSGPSRCAVSRPETRRRDADSPRGRVNTGVSLAESVSADYPRRGAAAPPRLFSMEYPRRRDSSPRTRRRRRVFRLGRRVSADYPSRGRGGVESPAQ